MNGLDVSILARDATELWYTLSSWSQATFGADGFRGPIGPIRHLQLEAIECENAIVRNLGRAAVSIELADCLILILDASRRHGLTLIELIDIANHKMRINMERKWPDSSVGDMPVEHIRDIGDE